MSDLSNIENNQARTHSNITVSKSLKQCRVKNPTSSKLKLRSKVRRRKETIEVCRAIHGGTADNLEPTIEGMVDTLTAKCKSNYLALKIMKSKNSLAKSISLSCIKQHNIEFYSSESNILRSLNVYYSSNVMGKRKYISVRKSNRGPAVVNFVSYKKLSKFTQEIDIGVLHDINPILTEGMPDEEIGPGFFRNTCSYVKRLAKFYLIVNEKRVDKIPVDTP